MLPLSSAIAVIIHVNKPVAAVWQHWTNPGDIMQWNIPFDDWHCPVAENQVRPGGQFFFRMEAKDGSAGFDYKGRYDNIIQHQLIELTQAEGRRTVVTFAASGDTTTVVESFEPETSTPVELQREFCQSVLQKFKNFVETSGDLKV